jgi:GNAT superfamily N-acetyltransferase
MYHVKNMLTEDWGFAVQITDTMNWGMTEEDFAFMMQLEPEGCFTLFSNSERIGIATTISYGKIGWFGNLIVNKNERGRGAGTLLVKHSLEYLKSKEVRTIGLYAYIDKIPFYERLGFKYDSEFMVLRGKGFSIQAEADLKEARNDEKQAIIDFDRSCFGASRRKILEPLLSNQNSLCYVSFEDGHVLGYAVAKVYEKIAMLGPLLTTFRRGDVAAALLKTVLEKLRGYEVSLCVSKEELTLVDLLMKSGFAEDFRVARMFYGPNFITDCVYVAESLERG